MKNFLLLAILTLISATFAQAQDGISDAEVEELVDFINGTVNGLVNATTLFTSQEAVSSGYFKFYSNTADRDIKFRVLKVPFKLALCDDKNSAVRPYVKGMYGQSSEIENIAPDPAATGDYDFSAVYTWSGSLGAGVDLELFDNFTVTPDFQATYSKVKNKYHYHNDVSQFVGSLVDGQVFNWNLDVMTYTPSIRAQYVIPMESFITTFQSSFSHLINRSFDSSSDILDINSSTNLVRNMVQVEVPTGATIANVPINVRPFFSRSELGGSARRALGFAFFYESGFDVVFKVKDVVPLFNELSLAGAYTWADDMEGYRVGIGGAF